MSEIEKERYKLGDDCLLDPTNKRLWRRNKPRTITPQDVDLLLFLVENRDRLVTREELRKRFWGNQTIEFNQNQSLNQAIHRLRDHLGGSAEDRTYIKTFPKRGYQFVAAVEIVRRPTASSQPEPGPSSAAPRDKIITVVLGAGVVLTVSGSVYGIIRQSDGTRTFAAIAQFAVICIALVYSLWNRPKNFQSIEPKSEEQIRQASGHETVKEWPKVKQRTDVALTDYTRGWYGLLFSWCCFYFWQACTALDPPGVSRLGQDIGVILLNNCNSMFSWMCYEILKDKPVAREGDRYVSNAPWWLYAFIVLALTMIEVYALTWGSNRADSYEIIQEIIFWVSGILDAIILFFYVHHLWRSRLGLPLGLLVTFYLYVAIQLLYAGFRTVPTAEIVVWNLALILKCLFYLYMTHLFQSQQLLAYFVPPVDVDGEPERNDLHKNDPL